MISTSLSDSASLIQYQEHVKTLLTAIQQWAATWSLEVQAGETSIHEEAHGPYTMPTLVLVGPDARKVAEVVPFGQSIIGAAGRVDVVGEYGKREKMVYLAEGGPTIATSPDAVHRLYRGVTAPGWYWVSPPPIRRAYAINQEVFADLMSAVTGHEFKS